jgi:hypothetical protein
LRGAAQAPKAAASASEPAEVGGADRASPSEAVVRRAFGSLAAPQFCGLIDRGRFEEDDLAPLARDRFTDPSRWVTEDLHI